MYTEVAVSSKISQTIKSIGPFQGLSAAGLWQSAANSGCGFRWPRLRTADCGW